MHNTGNPLGSKDILDLYDNSETIDNFVNSQQDETPDRFGTKRLTLAGLIKRSMALRNEINDFSGALTFKPEWSDVPMNVSEGVGGEGGALNLQAEALGNRSEINKITSGEALRRSCAESGYTLVTGSFESGGKLVNASDVLLQERTGKVFSGPAGTVAAGTNPASGGFIDVSASLLRDYVLNTTTATFKNEHGYSAVENMIAGRVKGIAGAVVHKAGNIYSTGGTTWECKVDNATAIGDFKALTGVNVLDCGGKVDGTTDDTLAIAEARNQVSDVGGTVVANGKAYSPSFWENLFPRAMEWIYGSDSDYKTDTKSSKPLIWLKQFIGAPVTSFGYDHYGAAFDSYTKAGIDVQSGATAIFRMASYSNNSEGTNFNKTTQVALVASANSLSATSSASVEAVNGIATSAYTGSLAQMVIGFEADLNAARAPGFFGEADSTYSVGFSSNWTGGSFDGTVAYAAGTSNASKTWLHGLISSGSRNTGVTVTRNGDRRPTTGVWVAAAYSHGVYIGAKSLNPMNPGQGSNYKYKPSVGIALGQEGDTSSPSHKLRFTSTDAGGVEQHCDMQLGEDAMLRFSINGVSNRFGIGPTGTVYIQNTAVVGTRKTGYTAFTGAVNRGTVYDVSTITLQQLASRVAAIQADLSAHGLIGA